jgi:hypothetical protein
MNSRGISEHLQVRSSSWPPPLLARSYSLEGGQERYLPFVPLLTLASKVNDLRCHGIVFMDCEVDQ